MPNKLLVNGVFTMLSKGWAQYAQNNQHFENAIFGKKEGSQCMNESQHFDNLGKILKSEREKVS